MKAIILAAGCGRRMKHLTEHGTKALLPLHGRPLIEWQMEALKQAGISQVAIVTGYKSDVFHYPVTYFHNAFWDQTQMFSSLQCAKDWLQKETCLVCYSDILYDADAVRKLIDTPGDVAITYDPNWLNLWQQRFDDPLSDAEIFQHANNVLLDIGGKTNDLNEIQGQYMGLLKFSVAGWTQVTALLQDLSDDEIKKMDMTMLLKSMLRVNRTVVVTPINTPWFEIDSEADYNLLKEASAFFRSKDREHF